MISFRILMTCQFLGHQLRFQVLFPTRLSLRREPWERGCWYTALYTAYVVQNTNDSNLQY